MHTLVNRSAIAAALLGLAACGTFSSYESPLAPRYAADLPSAAFAPTRALPAALRVVTYNVQFARHVDRAIVVLKSRAGLRDADIIALQEMDADGTRRIADALGMGFVYYPAGVHPKTGRDMGNAILSRWPIVADEKLALPYAGRLRHTTRIATAATVLVGDREVRVYSIHLGTQTDIGPGRRRDQIRPVLADAARYPRVVVAGDMNSHGIGNAFSAVGFLWPTEHNPVTTAVFNWDHIFFKGFAAPDSARTGVVRDTLRTSDHDPVWAVLLLPAVPPK
jgi:endonuclease/exonuclease/phosphatase family metal-dependent hydrolase